MIAFVACGLVLITCITGLVLVCRWPSERYEPHHAKPRPGPRDTTGLADPEDTTDRDGEKYLARLAATACDAPDLATLARVSRALAGLPEPASPDHEPVPDVEPDVEPDATGVLPHAVCIWGKTPGELTDELAAEYLTVTQ
jgi:hypothetical protein